jgi:hypothetical protein
VGRPRVGSMETSDIAGVSRDTISWCF